MIELWLCFGFVNCGILSAQPDTTAFNITAGMVLGPYYTGILIYEYFIKPNKK